MQPTTAQLREQAREAEARLDYVTAADLFTQAADAYPAVRGGALQQADIAHLRRSAARCTRMAELGVEA